MSLASCPKCWDTPCTCGHDYRDWSAEKIREQIVMLQRVLGTRSRVEPVTAPPSIRIAAGNRLIRSDGAEVQLAEDALAIVIEPAAH